VWRIACFLLSSLLCASGCKTPAAMVTKTAAECMAVNENRGKDVRYRAGINVAGKHLSGMLILKESAADTTHAVFVTETGFRFFDILVLRDTVVVGSMLSKLDKPIVHKLLCTDIQLLTHAPIGAKCNIIHRNKQLSFTFVKHRETTEYRCNETCDTLNSILFRRNGIKKVKVRFYGMKNKRYERIVLTHLAVPVKMNLELIED